VINTAAIYPTPDQSAIAEPVWADAAPGVTGNFLLAEETARAEGAEPAGGDGAHELGRTIVPERQRASTSAAALNHLIRSSRLTLVDGARERHRARDRYCRIVDVPRDRVVSR
jgi:hypothetical protein